MRQAVYDLLQLGPLPDEETDDVELFDQYEQLLHSISPPITDEEACALVTLFGPDDSSFGLAWTLLHLIETAPGWPLEDCLSGRDNEWIRRLHRGVENRRRRLEQ